jgi:hypothetical protein
VLLVLSEWIPFFWQKTVLWGIEAFR